MGVYRTPDPLLRSTLARNKTLESSVDRLREAATASRHLLRSLEDKLMRAEDENLRLRSEVHVLRSETSSVFRSPPASPGSVFPQGSQSGYRPYDPVEEPDSQSAMTTIADPRGTMGPPESHPLPRSLAMVKAGPSIPAFSDRDYREPSECPSTSTQQTRNSDISVPALATLLARQKDTITRLSNLLNQAETAAAESAASANAQSVAQLKKERSNLRGTVTRLERSMVMLKAETRWFHAARSRMLDRTAEFFERRQATQASRASQAGSPGADAGVSPVPAYAMDERMWMQWLGYRSQREEGDVEGEGDEFYVCPESCDHCTLSGQECVVPVIYRAADYVRTPSVLRRPCKACAAADECCTLAGPFNVQVEGNSIADATSGVPNSLGGTPRLITVANDETEYYVHALKHDEIRRRNRKSRARAKAKEKARQVLRTHADATQSTQVRKDDEERFRIVCAEMRAFDWVGNTSWRTPFYEAYTQKYPDHRPHIKAFCRPYLNLLQQAHRKHGEDTTGLPDLSDISATQLALWDEDLGEDSDKEDSNSRQIHSNETMESHNLQSLGGEDLRMTEAAPSQSIGQGVADLTVRGRPTTRNPGASPAAACPTSAYPTPSSQVAATPKRTKRGRPGYTVSRKPSPSCGQPVPRSQSGPPMSLSQPSSRALYRTPEWMRNWSHSPGGAREMDKDEENEDDEDDADPDDDYPSAKRQRRGRHTEWADHWPNTPLELSDAEDEQDDKEGDAHCSEAQVPMPPSQLASRRRSRSHSYSHNAFSGMHANGQAETFSQKGEEGVIANGERERQEDVEDGDINLLGGDMTMSPLHDPSLSDDLSESHDWLLASQPTHQNVQAAAETPARATMQPTRITSHSRTPNAPMTPPTPTPGVPRPALRLPRVVIPARVPLPSRDRDVQLAQVDITSTRPTGLRSSDGSSYRDSAQPLITKPVVPENQIPVEMVPGSQVQVLSPGYATPTSDFDFDTYENKGIYVSPVEKSGTATPTPSGQVSANQQPPSQWQDDSYIPPPSQLKQGLYKNRVNDSAGNGEPEPSSHETSEPEMLASDTYVNQPRYLRADQSRAHRSRSSRHMLGTQLGQ